LLVFEISIRNINIATGRSLIHSTTVIEGSQVIAVRPLEIWFISDGRPIEKADQRNWIFWICSSNGGFIVTTADCSWHFASYAIHTGI
jgi:hypothetical protein